MVANEKDKEIMAYVQLLFNKYECLVLDIHITSKVATRSVQSLRKDLEKSRGIPCTKTGMATGSDPVKYGIYDIATYIVERKRKTFNI